MEDRIDSFADLQLLDESASYLLCNEWETVLLIEKATRRFHVIGDHYGDPTAGIISPDEQWCISAGEGILYFDFKRGLREFLRGTSPVFVYDAKLHAANGVRLLIDPWSEDTAIWTLDVHSLTVARLSDGPRLAGRPYYDIPRDSW